MHLIVFQTVYLIQLPKERRATTEAKFTLLAEVAHKHHVVSMSLQKFSPQMNTLSFSHTTSTCLLHACKYHMLHPCMFETSIRA